MHYLDCFFISFYRFKNKIQEKYLILKYPKKSSAKFVQYQYIYNRRYNCFISFSIEIKIFFF